MPEPAPLLGTFAAVLAVIGGIGVALSLVDMVMQVGDGSSGLAISLSILWLSRGTWNAARRLADA